MIKLRFCKINPFNYRLDQQRRVITPGLLTAIAKMSLPRTLALEVGYMQLLVGKKINTFALIVLEVYEHRQ